MSEMKVYHRQTGKFLGVVAENMPQIPSEVMQAWLSNPKALQHALHQLMCWPIEPLIMRDSLAGLGGFEEIDCGGYVISRLKDGSGRGRIIAIRYYDRLITLGQRMYSNGRMFVEAGRMGLVTEICKPDANGLTSDVISVLFEGHESPLKMKFKDLDISGQEM